MPHTNRVTHVQCSRSHALVHDVYDQATKQPKERRCSCYRG